MLSAALGATRPSRRKGPPKSERTSLPKNASSRRLSSVGSGANSHEKMSRGYKQRLTSASKRKKSSFKRGAPGADLIHKVMDKGRACGVIVYDSKNRASWLSSYATKLKQDQSAHQAQHAILSTQAFPSGSRQLHLLDGIILANPARVSIIAQLLRSHIVQMDTLKLRNDARAGSTVRLYDYIVSDECEQWFEQIEKSVTDMEQLEIIELKAHEKVWKQRHQLIRGVQQAYTGISSAVDHIV